MTFEECCSKCLDNKEFVQQFNRLTGHSLGVTRTPVQVVIDNACDFNQNEDAMPAFIEFVFGYVWIPFVMR